MPLRRRIPPPLEQELFSPELPPVQVETKATQLPALVQPKVSDSFQDMVNESLAFCRNNGFEPGALVCKQEDAPMKKLPLSWGIIIGMSDGTGRDSVTYKPIRVAWVSRATIPPIAEYHPTSLILINRKPQGYDVGP